MPKLTDSQLVILSAAAQRADGKVLPLPKSLKIRGATATRILKGLCKKGLIEERPAVPDTEAWHEDEDGRRMMLVVTRAGLEAIDGGPPSKSRKRAASAKTRMKEADAKQKPALRRPSSKISASLVRPSTKQALLIELLERKTGATIEEIVDAIGWQAHSVRGAISGVLKKKLGLDVVSEQVEGRGRVYRIVKAA